MSKFYKSLLLIAWFTVEIADTQKLVAQNQVQTFNCHIASGNDDAEKAFNSGRINFTSPGLAFTESSREGIYFLLSIEKGESAVMKLMNNKVYRSI